MLIGISGKIKNGKDEVLKIFQNLMPSVVNVKFADKSKDLIVLLTNCTKQQLEDHNFKESFNSLFGMTYRQMMQKTATLLRDEFDKEVWVKLAMLEASKHDNVIISDLRQENEYNAIKDKGGITIRVDRYLTALEWADLYRLPLNHNMYKFLQVFDEKIKTNEFIEKITCFLNFSSEIGVSEEEQEFVLNLINVLNFKSETELDNTEFDYIIINDGTLEELKTKIVEIWKKIK